MQSATQSLAQASKVDEFELDLSSRCSGSEPSELLTPAGYGKRFIVRTDEELTAFIELQSAIRDARSRTQSAIFLANPTLSLLSNPS